MSGKARKIPDEGEFPGIPVAIDSVKQSEEFSMSRCQYFTIACDSPSAGWTLDVGELEIPFLMVNLCGVVYGPVGSDGQWFDSREDFETLYKTVESRKGLYVDTDDIWFPNCLFDSKYCRSGAVYRVGQDLFDLGLQFRRSAIGTREFVGGCDSLMESIRYSESETIALSDWVKMQIGEAHEAYHSNPELYLRRKEKGREAE